MNRQYQRPQARGVSLRMASSDHAQAPRDGITCHVCARESGRRSGNAACKALLKTLTATQMSDTQDFSFIAQQLAWLEGYLRDMPVSEETQRLEAAVASLKRARAVMLELDHLSNAAQASSLTSAG